MSCNICGSGSAWHCNRGGSEHGGPCAYFNEASQGTPVSKAPQGRSLWDSITNPTIDYDYWDSSNSMKSQSEAKASEDEAATKELTERLRKELRESQNRTIDLKKSLGNPLTPEEESIDEENAKFAETAEQLGQGLLVFLKYTFIAGGIAGVVALWNSGDKEPAPETTPIVTQPVEPIYPAGTPVPATPLAYQFLIVTNSANLTAEPDGKIIESLVAGACVQPFTEYSQDQNPEKFIKVLASLSDGQTRAGYVRTEKTAWADASITEANCKATSLGDQRAALANQAQTPDPQNQEPSNVPANEDRPLLSKSWGISEGEFYVTTSDSTDLMQGPHPKQRVLGTVLENSCLMGLSDYKMSGGYIRLVGYDGQNAAAVVGYVPAGDIVSAPAGMTEQDCTVKTIETPVPAPLPAPVVQTTPRAETSATNSRPLHYLVEASVLNVRTTPSANAQIASKVSAGTCLLVDGTEVAQNGFIKAKTVGNQELGYVSLQHIKPIPEESAPGICSEFKNNAAPSEIPADAEQTIVLPQPPAGTYHTLYEVTEPLHMRSEPHRTDWPETVDVGSCLKIGPNDQKDGYVWALLFNGSNSYKGYVPADKIGNPRYAMDNSTSCRATTTPALP